MTRRPTGSTRSATLTPYTTLFRSFGNAAFAGGIERVELRGLLLPLQPHGAGVVEFGDALRVGDATHDRTGHAAARTEEHTSELQSLIRISYAVFCLKKKTQPISNFLLQSTSK